MVSSRHQRQYWEAKLGGDHPTDDCRKSSGSIATARANCEQHRLIEEHAGGPNRRRAAENRQGDLREHRLYQEQQGSTNEQSEREDRDGQ
jgi:hypothetical protein